MGGCRSLPEHGVTHTRKYDTLDVAIAEATPGGLLVLDDGEPIGELPAGVELSVFDAATGRFYTPTELALEHRMLAHRFSPDRREPILADPDVDLTSPSVIEARDRYYMYVGYLPEEGRWWKDREAFYCATSTDLEQWTLQGQVFGVPDVPGSDGAIANPTVIQLGERYYMWYIGFSEGADAYDQDIFLAASDSPEGPFDVANDGRPVVESSEPYDSATCGDPHPIVDGDRIRLYYKGRGGRDDPGPRTCCLATTGVEMPSGPYEKHPANPLLDDPDHEHEEFMVWTWRGKYYMTCAHLSSAGDGSTDRGNAAGALPGTLLYVSDDGIDWERGIGPGFVDRHDLTRADGSNPMNETYPDAIRPFFPDDGAPRFFFQDQHGEQSRRIYSATFEETMQVPGAICTRAIGAPDDPCVVDDTFAPIEKSGFYVNLPEPLRTTYTFQGRMRADGAETVEIGPRVDGEPPTDNRIESTLAFDLRSDAASAPTRAGSMRFTVPAGEHRIHLEGRAGERAALFAYRGCLDVE